MLIHFLDRTNNNSDYEDPDELDEDNDWETQQIRKAVTGSQLAAAQQESVGLAAMYNNITSQSMVMQEQPNAQAMINQRPRFPNSYVPQGLMTKLNPDEIIYKTREMYVILIFLAFLCLLIVFVFRLNELKEKRIPDQKYFEDMTDEIPEIKNKIEVLKKNVPELAECFQFYQDLRGYVTDLVECLDEKVGEFSSCSDVISIDRLVKELLLKK